MTQHKHSEYCTFDACSTYCEVRRAKFASDTDAAKRAAMDDIANEQGCEIQPGAFGRSVIVVQGYHQQGGPPDELRIRKCREALEAAGFCTNGLLC